MSYSSRHIIYDHIYGSPIGRFWDICQTQGVDVKTPDVGVCGEP